MKRNVIIDYLNISSTIKLIKNERGSNVTALFRPQSKVLESFLIKVIGLFNIKYSLDKMLTDKLSINIANNIHRRTMLTVNEISKEYIYNSSSKANKYFNFILKNWLLHELWRQVSIIEYVVALKIHFDALYIATQVNNRLLLDSSSYSPELKNRILVHYKSSSSIDDYGYGYRRKRSKIKYIGKKISNLIEVLFNLFFVKLRIKVPINKIDLLIFSHFPYKWVNMDGIQNLAMNSRNVYPNGMVGNDKDAFQIKSIYWSEIFSFYAHNISGIFKFLWALNISPDLFSDLIKSWKFEYMLNSLYSNYNTKIILSNYESPISKLATALASDNQKMISLDCLWSIGERPSEFAFTQNKMSDRFFVWGTWHHDLMNASRDNSGGHIISGYIGDYLFPLMKTMGKNLVDKKLNKFNKIITVFDSGSSEEGWYPKYIYIDYLKAIMLIAEEFNCLVVLKTKKGSNRYEEIFKSNDDGRLIIESELGSLVMALNSDVVIGVGSSGPVSVASAHGKQVVLYDPNNIVWNQWSSNKNFIPLVRSLPNLKIVLKNLLKDDFTLTSPSPKYIDPYGDYKAQDRVKEYIQNVFDNLYLGKSKAIFLADDAYKKQWGNDKVIIKNKELNEKNNI